MNTLHKALCCALLATPFAFAQDGLPREAPSTTPQPTASETTQRNGTYPVPKPKRPRIQIKNRYELEGLGLRPPGYAWTYDGKVEGNNFNVSAMTMISPDGLTTLRFQRFEAHATVRGDFFKGLHATIAGVERSVRKGPYTSLERFLAGDIKSHRKAGAYTIRGWAIDSQSACGLERSVLLDGVQVNVKREDSPKWASRFYGKGVEADPERNVVYTYKIKFVTPVRSEPSAGLSGSVSQQ